MAAAVTGHAYASRRVSGFASCKTALDKIRTLSLRAVRACKAFVLDELVDALGAEGAFRLTLAVELCVTRVYVALVVEESLLAVEGAYTAVEVARKNWVDVVGPEVAYEIFRHGKALRRLFTCTLRTQ